MKKRFLNKFLKISAVLALLITSFNLTSITSVKALPSNVTGDQILARAKTYDAWDYWSVGTCTGFVTRVLDDLGIADAVVGSMVGTSARYSPDQMLANARANPQDAVLVYEGTAYGAYSAGVKNGDIAIATAADMGSSFGHVAFIEIIDGVIGWYGANNAVTNVGWQPIGGSRSRGTPPGGEYNGNIHIFRLVDDVQPAYANTSSMKEATETVTVSLTKTDVDTGKPLSDASFDFFRDDQRFAQDVKTDVNGVATATSTVKYTGTSKSYRYCSNFDQLSAQKKQEVINAGIYTSKASAQSVADAEAQKIANDKANQEHTYSAIERQTKTKYWLDVNNNTVSNEQTGNGSVSMALTNERVRGIINLIKVDSETGNRVPQGDAKLDGAVYGLFAREDILDPADSSIIYRAGEEVTRVTIKDTSAKVEDLYLGKYYWKEIKAPVGYNLDTQEYDVDMAYVNQDTKTVEKTVTVREDVIKGKLKIAKKDKDTGKVIKREGFEFKVYFHDGTLVDTITTGTDGYATSKDLPYGSYYFYESHSGSHYVVDTETKTEAVVETNNSIVAKEFKDVRVNATLNLTKEDSDYGDSPQGDATLEGAIYGLYAKNNIMDPSNDGTILYKKDALVDKVTIKDGKAVVKNLYLGDYYWKEITPSKGYTLDKTKYDVTPEWEGENTITVKRSTLVKETVIKQAFEIIKVSSDGGNNNNVPALQNAEFTYILTEYVAKYGSFDKALKAIKAGETDIKDSEWGVMTTDQKGYAKSKELPYGNYTVSETVVPDEHLKVADFSVVVEKDSREPQQWKIINDAAYTSMLAIVKMDAETGKIVRLENATFKIFNVDKQEYVGFWNWNPLPMYMTEFKTNESGQVFLPDVLQVGNYRLEEVRSPEGYTLNNNPVPFRITEDNMTQVGPDAQTPVLTVFMTDVSVKGKINVYKEGEVLTDVKLNKDGNYEFVYEVKPLANATYGIYADEDIYSADNQGDLIYKKGVKVDTVTTGTNGKAVSKDLPLGNYIVKEETAPNGMVLNEKVESVSLEYADQNTAIVYDDVTFKNDRQKIEIDTQKKDADTSDLVANAEFTLYAKEDILSFNGTVLIKKDTKVETVITSDSGKANFKADLPLAEYVLKETKAPLGYASTDKQFNVDASYQGQNKDVIKFDYEFVNEPTVVSISKQDITTSVETAGNILQVFDSKGNKVDEWTSIQGEQHIIKYLHVGEEYTLVEYLAKDGYLKAEDIKFSISDTGEVQNITPMLDERVTGQITVYKTGEVLVGTTEKDGNVNFVYEEQKLPNAVYEVYADQDIKHPDEVSEDFYKKDELVTTLVTDSNGKAVSGKLPLGRYRIVEKTAPQGFVNNSSTKFAELEYEDQYTEIVFDTVNYENERQKIEINTQKKDADTNDLVANAEFTLYAKENILAIDGSVLVEAGSKVRTVKTGKDGTADFGSDLPLSQYKLKETKAPLGYASTDKEFDIDARYQGQEVEVIKLDYEFVNEPTVVSISKQDITSEVETEGNILQVFDSKGNKVDEWTSVQGEKHIIKYLHVGEEYTLVEYLARYGYLKADDIKFTILDTGEVQSVTMKDERVYGKISVHKEGEVLTGIETDKNGNIIFVYEEKSLANAVYEVYAAADIKHPDGVSADIYKAGDLVTSLTTDENGDAVSGKLPLGYYLVDEKTAPNGFTVYPYRKAVSLLYEDQFTELVFDHADVVNERQKIEINTQKKDADTNDLVANAEFTLYAKEDIFAIDGSVLVEAGSKVRTVKTGKDGTADFGSDLPLSQYKLKETKAPLGYASTDKEFDIDARYQGQEVEVIKLDYEFVNEPTVVSISKQDITSEVETEGNILQVFDSKGNKVDEWTSVQGEKHIIKYLHVGEEYTLVEYLAREGYLKADDIKFTISDTGKVQPVTMKDERVYGQITIHKTGEVLVGTTEEKDGNINFVYKTDSLANAVYEIYAAVDIKHPDGVSADIYKAGDLVTTLMTDSSGKVVSGKLPLGRYRVVEKTAPEGFVNNESVQFANLIYEDQYTELVFDTASYDNQRQKVEISVKKQDSETGKFLKGAEFTLYAGKDIVDVKGNVLITKDTAIEKVSTNKDGKAKFKADMPLGFYYVKETKAPIGYASNDIKVEVDATYQGQDVTLISHEKGFMNDITKVEISKTDITTDKELAGNHLTVFEKDNEGAIFDTWVSGDKPHMIYGLEVGKAYVLRETSSAYGFAISKDIEFTIADTGEIQKVKMENKLVEGQLAWNKTGEIFMSTDTGMNEFGTVHTPVWEKSNLLGSEITIYADEDITLGNNITYFIKDEAIEVLESDWDTVYSQKLPVGKYYYVETKVPHGRVPDTDKHYFEIEDNQKDELQVIVSELENGRTTYELDFTKRMEFSDTSINKEAYKDVVFGIYTLDDTYNYMGQIAIKADTLIGTSGIDDEGHLIQKYDLPVGNYYVKELATNSAYTLDENKYPFSIEESSEEKVVVEINEGKELVNTLKEYYVLINKVDDKTMKNIISEDFAFTSYTDKYCTDEIETIHANTKDGTAKFVLSYGTTYIKETQAPKGYQLSTEVIKVEINDDGVFVNNKKVEHDKDLLYSITYANSSLPIIETGDTTNITPFTLMLGLSGMLIVLLSIKNKRQRQ